MTSLFGHTVRSDLLLLFVADVLVCFMAVFALLVWQAGFATAQGLTLGMIVAGATGLIGGASGLYRPDAFGHASRLLVAIGVAGLLLLLLLLALPLLAQASGVTGEAVRRHLPGILLAFAAAIVVTRMGFALALRSGVLGRRLLVLRGRQAREALPELSRLDAAIALGGHFRVAFDTSVDAQPPEQILDPAWLRRGKIRAVILADGAAIPEAMRRRCESVGISVLGEADFIERQFARVDVDRLPPNWLARSNALRETLLEAALRRSLDIALGCILLAVTLPLLLLTALAIKLDSPGPVFYRQERVGRGGRVFRIFKFRSMVVDAEACGTPVWASKGDARITRVGRLIRLTRIDEIPQVLNVLRGEMAFVGPRPERPAFVEQLAREIPHYDERAVVKPGITGWAQVNYSYGASVEDARMKLAYDLYYVRRRSLFLDLLILVATVRVVLFQEGSR